MTEVNATLGEPESNTNLDESFLDGSASDGSALDSSALDGRSDFPVSFIKSLPIFADLTLQQLESATAVVRRQNLEEGEFLVNESQPGDNIFIIVEGSVKISVTRGEEEVILGFRGRGEIIGEMAVLDGASRSATVKAQTPCVIACISRQDFWNTLWPMPKMPYNVAILLTERVRRLTSQLQAMAVLDVPGRLARQILALSQEHAVIYENGLTIPFCISQIELAQMIGATRVQVNRTLQSWKKQEIISVKRNSIVINKPEKLRQVLEASENAKPKEE